MTKPMISRKRAAGHFFLAAGAAWGLCETGIGLGLRGLCQAGISAALLAGFGLFCLAAAVGFSGRRLPSPLVLLLAVLLRLLAAPILGRPLDSPAIFNPAFALVTEFAALVAVLALLGRGTGRSLAADMGRGAMAALTAAPLFLAVGFLSRQPACLAAGTAIPACLYFVPLSVAIAAPAFAGGVRFGRAAEQALGARTPLAMRLLDAAALAMLAAVVLIERLRG